ncbi:oxidoreductase, selenocysteine-containing [Desulfovibrio ferrophilus]|uniref:Oxidoreductase, selenocysteine-containing n=2 Tax=Desulfovibrio ferrophilus TaxID=241368 RepID=A0A2Z6B210_9BACT|nr:oxidoreductase, selenocysteine-containing [Desulfovibrio ferrophilus]
MGEAAVLTANPQKSLFMNKVKALLPEGGNLNMCLTCGACSAGCPATGLEDMNPRKFLRMAALGLDEEVTSTPWVWMCTMCRRCVYACPMAVDIPQLVYYARQSWPRDQRPKGIIGSCDQALKNSSNSAMGASSDDFVFVVEDVLEEVRESQTGFEDLQASIDREGAYYFLNQNSREPVTEPDEMVPLWKILHQVGADWTYGTQGWAAENYCMFLADDQAWEQVVRNKAAAVDALGCKVWLNTE